MPSFYTDGARYPVDPTRSLARFCLNGIGVPVIRGTLPVRSGELIIDADELIRTANFQLDVAGLAFETALPLGEPDPRAIFGNVDHAVVEFETQWARERAPARHELDGLLRLVDQEHVFTLRADRGAWGPMADEPHPNLPHWYRGVVRGGFNRKDWELRSHSIADDLLLLLGREVEFEVTLVAGPRHLAAGRRRQALRRAS